MMYLDIVGWTLGGVVRSFSIAVGHLFEPEKHHQACPMSTAKLFHGYNQQYATPLNVQPKSSYIIVCDMFHQAFLHISTAGNKHWSEKAWASGCPATASSLLINLPQWNPTLFPKICQFRCALPLQWKHCECKSFYCSATPTIVVSVILAVWRMLAWFEVKFLTRVKEWRHNTKSCGQLPCLG